MNETPGWFPDPSGRHDRRYWTGVRWSKHVLDGEVRSIDFAGATERPATDSDPPDEDGGRRLWRLVVAAGVLVTGAIAVLLAQGDGDDDGGPDTTLESDRAELAGEIASYVYDTGAGTINQAQADCMGDRWVDGFASDRIVELNAVPGGFDEGSLPTVLSPEEAQAAYRSSFACLDDQALRAFVSQSVQASTQIPTATADCMVQGWFDRLGRDALISMMTIVVIQDPETPVDQTMGQLPPEQRDIFLEVSATCASQAAA